MVRHRTSRSVDDLALGRDEDDVGRLAEARHHAFDLVREKQVIVHEPVHIRRIEVVIINGARPILLRIELRMMLIRDARVVREFLFVDALRLLVVAVVRDVDVEVLVRLLHDAPQRFAEIRRTLVRRDDDGDERFVLVSHAVCLLAIKNEACRTLLRGQTSCGCLFS